MTFCLEEVLDVVVELVILCEATKDNFFTCLMSSRKLIRVQNVLQMTQVCFSLQLRDISHVSVLDVRIFV